MQHTFEVRLTTEEIFIVEADWVETMAANELILITLMAGPDEDVVALFPAHRVISVVRIGGFSAASPTQEDDARSTPAPDAP